MLIVVLDAEEANSTTDPLADRKKRRAALVFGYVGTRYFGLQKSLEERDDLQTIEGVLEKALYKAGYIRESNYGDLDKVRGYAGLL